MNKFLLSKWIACRLVPDSESVKYGLYFSYPLYLIVVITGILLVNPYILVATALIAFLGIKLPLHPFDYVYNYTVARIVGTKKIPGRGSELQVNSIIALLFCLIVIALIAFSIPISFVALAIIYALSSVFFIVKFLF